jgi:hypothetical protein
MWKRWPWVSWFSCWQVSGDAHFKRDRLADPSIVPTPSTGPSPAASPTPSPSPACLPLQGGTSCRATITDVRAGSDPGYDHLVIEFSGGTPAYCRITHDRSTFVGPFSGQPIGIAGRAGIHLFIYNMDISPSFRHGTNLRPGCSVLKQVVVMGGVREPGPHRHRSRPSGVPFDLHLQQPDSPRHRLQE